MVFARTSKAASRLSEQIREKQFQKEYLAVIHGTPSKKSDTLTHSLIKNSTSNTSSVVHPAHKRGKEAILSYTVLETQNDLSLVKVTLKTGRHHQIRVQFSSIGHPLWGDQKYGRKFSKPGEQLALWAHSLTLFHPTTKEKMTFNAEPPQTIPWVTFTAPTLITKNKLTPLQEKEILKREEDINKGKNSTGKMNTKKAIEFLKKRYN